MPGCTPPAPGGLRRAQPWHTRTMQGRAVRGGSPRIGVWLAALALANRSGLAGARYALGEVTRQAWKAAGLARERASRQAS